MVKELPAQILPLLTVIVGLGATDTANVEAGEVPQPLIADTRTLPEAVPVVAEMELVVDVPDQPPGNVQLYELAPETVAML